MASHSPQRIRKPQAHPSTPGTMHLQGREMSPSPTHKPRTLKANSMPIVPTVMQIFGPGNTGQGSPTAVQRSPPNTRLLPSPPHSGGVAHDLEHRVTPPHGHNNHPNVNYPRPVSHMPPPEFLTKFEENWQMTEELMADIERADLQQSQNNIVHYPRDSPPKVDPAVERVRATERGSPKNLDGQQQQQQQQQQQRRQPLRESPKARQPISPTSSSFAQVPRQSEGPTQPSGDYEHGYNPYQNQDHGSPSQAQSSRRTSTAAPPPLLAVATHGQTPPLQAMAVNSRTPDRSLPVQEEQEDEVPAAREASRHYADGRDAGRSSSPTPSSDLDPEALARYDAKMMSHGGRNSRAGRRADEEGDDDDDDTLLDPELDQTVHTRGSRSGPEEEGSHTPRSPQSSLPPDHAIEPDRYPRYANANATIRARTRNGSTDQLGLQSLDPAMFASPDLERPPPQYVESRRDGREMQDYAPQQQRRYDSRPEPDYAHNMHPDELQHYMDHPTMQAYFRSPRPNAPIPPTPHSQTAAPSPSPLTNGVYDRQPREYPPYSPVMPAGSPYPYPFNHVRRNHSYPYAGRQHVPSVGSNYDPNHPSTIQEQLARQWQVYAQNQSALAGGHISDSTFSPAATPFQGGGRGGGAAFNPWAYVHANRLGVGRGAGDLHSLQSSPSHEPVALPIPPSIGLRKKERAGLARQLSARKPPPRVDSTQPRSTPEPDAEESSGEETAGEPEDGQRYAVPEEGNWVGLPVLDPTAAVDADWVDEEDEGDGEDLLELEYHPTYVSNVEKRRRRWETRWELLVQAFNALDRQTDTTLVLLAAPSHSTKLHSLTSRSVKRNPLLSQSPAMKEMRIGFRNIAAARRATRAHQSSLADRFMSSSNSSGDGSEGSAREEDLRRALSTALGSLGALKNIYEQREARWADEMRRISDDRERVELLLRQVLGEEPDTTGRAL